MCELNSLNLLSRCCPRSHTLYFTKEGNNEALLNKSLSLKAKAIDVTGQGLTYLLNANALLNASAVQFLLMTLRSTDFDLLVFRQIWQVSASA